MKKKNKKNGQHVHRRTTEKSNKLSELHEVWFSLGHHASTAPYRYACLYTAISELLPKHDYFLLYKLLSYKLYNLCKLTADWTNVQHGHWR